MVSEASEAERSPRDGGDAAELQRALQDKLEEISSLKLRIMARRQQAFVARQELLKRGIFNTSLVPNGIQAGRGAALADLNNAVAVAAVARLKEYADLLTWVAKEVDLYQPAFLDCTGSGDLVFGNKTAQLGKMVTFAIGRSGKRITFPVTQRGHVAAVLAAVRAGGGEEEGAVRKFAMDWDLHSTEMTVAEGPPEPTIVLQRRTTSQVIVVSAWPRVESDTAAAAGFDPVKHFARRPLDRDADRAYAPPHKLAFVQHFEVTADKTPARYLGIDVQRFAAADPAMVVVAVCPDGILAEWNQRSAAWAVRPGDRIVAVNGVCGCAAMDEQLLAGGRLVLKFERDQNPRLSLHAAVAKPLPASQRERTTSMTSELSVRSHEPCTLPPASSLQPAPPSAEPGQARSAG